MRCTVEAISFSAHADYEQTSGFLNELQPPHVVLVHGEAEKMGKLKTVGRGGGGGEEKWAGGGGAGERGGKGGASEYGND